MSKKTGKALNSLPKAYLEAMSEAQAEIERLRAEITKLKKPQSDENSNIGC